MSKIYKIYCEGKDEVYIGSTTLELSRRFSNHKSDHKIHGDKNDEYYITVFEIFKLYGIDNCKIELVLECSKEELRIKEQEVINNTENCVNIRKAYLTDEEKKKKIKQYYQDNKDRLRVINSSKIICDCGVEHRRDGIISHKRSQYHKNYENSKK